MYELDGNARPTVKPTNKNFIHLAGVLILYCRFRLEESGTCEGLENCESRSVEFVSASKDRSNDRRAKGKPFGH
jgi:hypothetical protein